MLVGTAAVLAAAMLWTAGLVLLSWRRPALGPVEGRLRPCGRAPNCVCSQSFDVEHHIDPLPVCGDPAEALQRLRTVMDALPHTSLVEARDGYLRYEFATPLLRYVDDVEFLLDAEEGVVHVRSASRVGHSDLGTNRKRVEEIRLRFLE